MSTAAITSPTLTDSMPRSRKRREAASNALLRVRAVASRDRRTRTSIKAELLAQRAVEDALGQIAAQAREQANAFAHRVAQPRLLGRRCLQHRFRHDRRIFAGDDSLS